MSDETNHPAIPEVSDAVYQEFERLFWAARREHSQTGKSALSDSPKHQEALSYARTHSLTGGDVLLDASLLDWCDRCDDALALLDDPALELHPSLAGLRWLVRGSILWMLKRYVEAGNSANQALKAPNLVRKGNAWLVVGLSLKSEAKYDMAITAYRRALDDPHFDLHGVAWNNIGNAFSGQGQHQQAIEAFRRALADPSFDMSNLATNNLARAYFRSGQREEAEKTLEKVPEGERDPLLVLMLSSDLEEMGLSAMDRARLESAPPIPFEERSPEARIQNKLNEAQETQYERYAARAGSGRNDVLSILRGWSSAVTLLEGADGVWRGGGYLLKWKDKGIVIDPGLDFIRNLHDSGFHAREIDAVLVSHNHPDHNADLLSLDDLRYELYKRRKQGDAGPIEPYVLVWDQDSQHAIQFSAEEPKHQHGPIMLDLGRCRPVSRIDSATLHGLPFQVVYFKVRHGTDLRHATGFRVELLHGEDVVFTLGYTGDTEYFPELPKLLASCDVLLAHISQPDPREFADPTFRKKIHLGYRGLADLIREAQPKLTLVGEFWAGLADIRIDLVQGLRRLSGTEAILPAGLGMHVNLPDMTVECSECKQPTPFDRVRVAPPADRFANLAYLCPDCLLT